MTAPGTVTARVSGDGLIVESAETDIIVQRKQGRGDREFDLVGTAPTALAAKQGRNALETRRSSRAGVDVVDGQIPFDAVIYYGFRQSLFVCFGGLSFGFVSSYHRWSGCRFFPSLTHLMLSSPRQCIG